MIKSYLIEHAGEPGCGWYTENRWSFRSMYCGGVRWKEGREEIR